MKKEPFPERLRRLSDGSGMTREQLCLKAGVPSSTFYNLLAGKSEPRLGVLAALARALGRNMDVWDGAESPSADPRRRRRKKRERA